MSALRPIQLRVQRSRKHTKNMKLQKVLWRALFAVFFILLLQGVRGLLTGASSFVVCNAAGSWSLAIPSTLLMVFGVIFLLGAFFFGLQSGNQQESLGWLLIFSGGASNLWERFIFGCVTDYISLFFFPTFNGADILITVGVLCILFASLGVKFVTRNNILNT